MVNSFFSNNLFYVVGCGYKNKLVLFQGATKSKTSFPPLKYNKAKHCALCDMKQTAYLLSHRIASEYWFEYTKSDAMEKDGCRSKHPSLYDRKQREREREGRHCPYSLPPHPTFAVHRAPLRNQMELLTSDCDCGIGSACNALKDA